MMWLQPTFSNQLTRVRAAKERAKTTRRESPRKGRSHRPVPGHPQTIAVMTVIALRSLSRIHGVKLMQTFAMDQCAPHLSISFLF